MKLVNHIPHPFKTARAKLYGSNGGIRLGQQKIPGRARSYSRMQWGSQSNMWCREARSRGILTEDGGRSGSGVRVALEPGGFFSLSPPATGFPVAPESRSAFAEIRHRQRRRAGLLAMSRRTVAVCRFDGSRTQRCLGGTLGNTRRAHLRDAEHSADRPLGFDHRDIGDAVDGEQRVPFLTIRGEQQCHEIGTLHRCGLPGNRSLPCPPVPSLAEYPLHVGLGDHARYGGAHHPASPTYLVAKDVPFFKAFHRDGIVSLGVAAISFVIGIIVKHTLGIDI